MILAVGRWTGVELLGRNGRTIAVICTYQVCQNQSPSGKATAYHQQVSLLCQRGILTPNPRKQFVTDLRTLIQSYHTSNYDIILLGDFNEVIGIPGSKQRAQAEVLVKNPKI